jgi:hypothetical protein
MRLPSVFKELDPIPQFKATAKLGDFLPDLPAEYVPGSYRDKNWRNPAIWIQHLRDSTSSAKG